MARAMNEDEHLENAPGTPDADPRYAVDLEELDSPSQRWLRHLPTGARAEVDQAVERISEQPRGDAPRYRHLKGPLLCHWRYRFHANGAQSRAIYDIDDAAQVVSVLRVGKRDKVYDT